MTLSPLVEKIKALASVVDTVAEDATNSEAVCLHLENVTVDVSVSVDGRQPEPVVGVDFRDDGRCALWVSQNVAPHMDDFIAGRIVALLPVFDMYYADGLETLGVKREHGFIYLNVGDNAEWPGLSFCGTPRDSFLIPDATFLETRGYEAYSATVDQVAPPWEERKAAAIWRGATTGPYVSHWRDLPRIKLCSIAAAESDLIDAGISWLVQGYEAFEDEIKAAGFMRDYMPAEQFAAWKYQIDIDGNTNSWPGLFQKLRSGSPVIKVGSPYRQWYYDRLIPWENYVPCRADMSDLIAQLNWLRDHDDEAREIGRKGRELALSMTYARELELTPAMIAAGLRAQMTYSRIFEPGFSRMRLYTDHDTILACNPETGKCLQVTSLLLSRAAPVMPLVVAETSAGPRLMTLEGEQIVSISPDGHARIAKPGESADSEIAIEFLDGDSLHGYAFKVGAKYLCAENDGLLTVSRDKAALWETFRQL